MAFSIPGSRSLARWLRPRRNDELPSVSSSETLRLLAENNSDVIFRFGVDGLARYISPSVEKLYGYSAAEIYAMGGDVVTNGFLHPDDTASVAAAVNAHFRGHTALYKAKAGGRNRVESLLLLTPSSGLKAA